MLPVQFKIIHFSNCGSEMKIMVKEYFLINCVHRLFSHLDVQLVTEQLLLFCDFYNIIILNHG